MKVKIQKTHNNAKVPTRSYDSEGYDLYSVEDVTLFPGDVKKIRLGIQTEFPKGYAALIWDKSGLATSGLHKLAGFIDSDYRGEWNVVLANLNRQYQDLEGYYNIIHLAAGTKVAQFVIQKVEDLEFEEVKELSETERGNKGFGSTSNISAIRPAHTYHHSEPYTGIEDSFIGRHVD